MCAELLKSKAFFYVLMYQFITGVLSSINTTAGGLVKNYWAGVRNLQNSIFSLVGNALFAIGLTLVRSRGLNVSWRVMLGVTTVFLNCVDMPFVFLTVFDVVRNQYFYLGETVLIEARPAPCSLLTVSLQFLAATVGRRVPFKSVRCHRHRRRYWRHRRHRRHRPPPHLPPLLLPLLHTPVPRFSPRCRRRRTSLSRRT